MLYVELDCKTGKEYCTESCGDFAKRHCHAQSVMQQACQKANPQEDEREERKDDQSVEEHVAQPGSG